MKGFSFYLLLFLAVIVPSVMIGQTYDMQFVEVQNDGSVFDVKLQIKANDTTFKMGSGNLVFTYNTGAISDPVLLSAENFSGTFYSPIGVAQPAAGRVSVNIELLLPNFGTEVPSTYIDIATIRFTITNPAGSVNLVWRTISPNATNVFLDDNSTIVPAGILHSFDEPLPIQLASFSATAVSQNEVRVAWATISETNNFGFEVQKAAGQQENYQTIPNSFVPGHGTTVEPHEYAFIDAAAVSGTWFYRLKQIDLDGTIHYSDGVLVDILSDVGDRRPLPAKFSLGQNYPNPFNPSTSIEFAVPSESHVKLELFNIIGERVAVLVDEREPAGYHTVRFDATNLSSGLYFYRFTSNEVTFVRKMTLMK